MTEPASRGRRVLRLVGFTLGLGLLGAAAWQAWRRREVIEDALAAVRAPDPWLVAIVLGAVLANLVLTGIFLALLLRRFGRVGWLETQMVVAAATLLNYLPLRPGLAGRLAYHRRYNDVPIAAGTRVMIEAIAASGLLAAWMLAVGAVLGDAPAGPWVALAAPFVVGALLGAANVGRPWTTALAVRTAELAAIALRTHAAYALLGAPIPAHASIGLAAVAVLATLVPFTSNGLGVREWAAGLLAPVLAGVPLELGVAAELVARAGELVVTAIAGGAAAAWVARRVARGGG